MKKHLMATIFCIAFFLLPLLANAADYVTVLGYTPFAHENITVATTAVSQLSATHRETAGAVFITVESNDIRYWIDGTAPDAANGHLVDSATMQNLWFTDPKSIKEFRAIAVGGNSTLMVTYYRKN